MSTVKLSGRDDGESGFDIVIANDATVRRGETLRLLRRELVELCFRAARSEMTNIEKLDVIHVISHPEPATFFASSPDALDARRRELVAFATRPGWTTEARRFLDLAEEAYRVAVRIARTFPVHAELEDVA